MGYLIKFLDYCIVLVVIILFCGFVNLLSLGICVLGIVVFCLEKCGILVWFVFCVMIGGIVVSMFSVFIVGIVILF